MELIEIPYATWRQVAQNNALSPFKIARSSTNDFAYVGSRAMGVVWRTNVSGSDKTDFDATWPNAVSVTTEPDALAHIIGLEMGALPTIQEVRPNLYPDGVTLTFTSRADHATNGRMLGDRFVASRADAGDNSAFEFGFNDWVVLAGGILRFKNAGFGDWVRYEITAPASPTPPTSGGAFNCKRVEIIPSSGLYMIVPATAGVDATHYLDLADGTKWVPIPAQKRDEGTKRRKPDGYWEWSYPDTGKGALIAKPNKDGWWNIFEFPVDPVARFVVDMLLLGDGSDSVGRGEALRPQVILPHWKHRVVLHNENGGNNFQLVWNLLVGRVKPTPGTG